MPTLNASTERGGLTPLELHALVVASREAAAVRDAVPVGELQEVDVSLRIVGTLDVAPDHYPPKKVAPDLEDVLAYVLEHLGPKTRESLVEHLVALYSEDVRPVPESRAEAKALIARMTRRKDPDKPTRGAVRGHLVISQVKRSKSKAA